MIPLLAIGTTLLATASDGGEDKGSLLKKLFLLGQPEAFADELFRFDDEIVDEVRERLWKSRNEEIENENAKQATLLESFVIAIDVRKVVRKASRAGAFKTWQRFDERVFEIDYDSAFTADCRDAVAFIAKCFVAMVREDVGGPIPLPIYTQGPQFGSFKITATVDMSAWPDGLEFGMNVESFFAEYNIQVVD